jgi:uncharacterized protein
MVDIARQLHLNAVEMLRQPGSTRAFELAVPGDAVSVFHDALDGPIDLRLRLETLNDGITVRGTIATPWRGVCRRCLAPLSGVDIADVDELYQKVVIDPDAYLIEDGQLDLVPLVRETALLQLDDERLCRPDCAGLCPQCGIDRNEESCDCDAEIRDERWAALDGLELDR